MGKSLGKRRWYPREGKNLEIYTGTPIGTKVLKSLNILTFQKYIVIYISLYIFIFYLDFLFNWTRANSIKYFYLTKTNNKKRRRRGSS